MQRRALARVLLLLLGCLGARLCRDLMSCVKHSAMDWCRLDAPLARLPRHAGTRTWCGSVDATLGVAEQLEANPV